MKIDLVCADVIKWASEYRGDKFHALLCDPPYELGFMGKNWDKSGIAFNPETWAAFAEHLHDGAFGMAFASSRGWHRLACAIEDAGLIIHPSIFGWAFGSGFPKATRIDTQVDKAAGAERAFGGETSTRCPDFQNPCNGHPNSNGSLGGGVMRHALPTLPATPLAQTWAGHRYGLQALKPALEPIIVFQKSYRGKPVDCITRTGAGALWIDGSRIGAEILHNKGMSSLGVMHDDNWVPKDISNPVTGRWASNLVLTHHPDCNGHCVDGCPIKALDEQSGERGNGHWSYKPAKDGGVYKYGLKDMSDGGRDSSVGGASRFFFQAQYDALIDADPVCYMAKASRRERDAGCDKFETRFMNDMDKTGSEKCGMKTGSGNPREGKYHNSHPTVKPIALARYLATLLLPPSAYAPRRILIPFAGVGSECIGSMKAGWDEIVGVEREQEYVDIAKARMEYYQMQMTMDTTP